MSGASTRTDGANARFLADTGGGAPAGSAGPAGDETPVTREETSYIRIDRWYTQLDERTCGPCAALAGQEFAEGDGPWPPLHDHCRCVRVTGVRYEATTRGSSEGARP